ncbi:hypothetical protein T492DRAFT_883326 [Pavlovales sp. CCMP2436]|nr:hypothetical protein T492DRAFT_883326 [Pavlovales sp. CCMP2436]
MIGDGEFEHRTGLSEVTEMHLHVTEVTVVKEEAGGSSAQPLEFARCSVLEGAGCRAHGGTKRLSGAGSDASSEMSDGDERGFPCGEPGCENTASTSAQLTAHEQMLHGLGGPWINTSLGTSGGEHILPEHIFSGTWVNTPLGTVGGAHTLPPHPIFSGAAHTLPPHPIFSGTWVNNPLGTVGGAHTLPPHLIFSGAWVNTPLAQRAMCTPCRRIRSSAGRVSTPP